MIDLNDGQQLVAAMDELYLFDVELSPSNLFREYARDYYSEEEFQKHFDLLKATAKRVAGGDEINDSVLVQILERALYLLIASGKIQKRKAAAAPIEETPIDTRPRDKNGKLLSSSQLAWGEHTRWANEHSSDECRKRAQTDEAFRSFMQTRLRQEMRVPIGDAVQPLAQVDPNKRVAASAEIQEFAFKCQRETAENLKPKGGFVTLAGQQIPYAEFKKKIDLAVAAGLQI